MRPASPRAPSITHRKRKPLNFTLDSLTAAREALSKLAKSAHQLAAKIEPGTVLTTADFGPFRGAWESLTQDLNTPGALGGIFTGLREATRLTGSQAAAALAGLNRILRALGLTLPEIPNTESIIVPEPIKALAEARWAARLAKDWAQSDTLRAELLEQGWLMKDGKEDYSLCPVAD